MRFMMLVKHAENLSGPPPKELMDAMAKLSEEAVKAGTLVDSGGAAPTPVAPPGPVFWGAGAAVRRAFSPVQGDVGRGVGFFLGSRRQRERTAVGRY